MSEDAASLALFPALCARPRDPASALALPVSATNVIGRLRQVRLLSARQAVEQLDIWRDSAKLLSLYQHFFPLEYARSTASTCISAPKEGRNWVLSPREVEFYRLINKKMLPLPDVLLDEEERLEYIPVTCQGLEWEDLEMDSEYWRPSMRVAVALTIGESEFDWSPWLPDDLRPHGGRIDWKLFVHLCRMAGAEKAFFPLLISMIGHDTGNIWLDTYDESGQYFDWTADNLFYLAHQWQAAKRILAKINRLMDAMEQDLRSWLTELVTFWNQVRVVEPPSSAPTIRTITPEEFVRGNYLRGQPMAVA